MGGKEGRGAWPRRCETGEMVSSRTMGQTTGGVKRNSRRWDVAILALRTGRGIGILLAVGGVDVRGVEVVWREGVWV